MAYQSCQVVPGEDELPCVQRGYGERPRLCNVHRQEYTRLTASYKARAEEADKLYEEVCGKDREDRSSCNMPALTEALGAAARCQNAIEEEILGRRRHHDRFFADRERRPLRLSCDLRWLTGFPLAGDSGHEAWIRRRQEKAREVEAIAKRLRVKKKLAEEKAQKAAARRREEEAAIWERSWSYASTNPRNDPPVSNYSQSYSQNYRTGCMVLQRGSTTFRCNRDVIRGKKICQQHSEELTTATTDLRLKRYQKSIRFNQSLDPISWNLSGTIYYDQCRLDADIATVVKWKELLSCIDTLSAEVDRLSPGEPASPSQADDHAKVDRLLRALRQRTVQPRPSPFTRSSRDDEPKEDAADSWVSTALMAVGTAVALWFGFKR
ncbi:hypothetical protein C8Q70DRAFT_107325 [Cubamyces menziesii]|nr:hypothetical protein C8Q70DRAFT_107325 [Cubamyces menziesii]